MDVEISMPVCSRGLCLRPCLAFFSIGIAAVTLVSPLPSAFPASSVLTGLGEICPHFITGTARNLIFATSND